MSITAHLSAISASSPSFAATIAHEFVASASAGTLTHSRLALWLAQDRIYAAHAYPRFIGSLIAGIPFSSADVPLSAEEMLNQTILRILIVALQGIADEVLFFDKIAQKYGLDLGEWAERKQTRDYTAEMGRVGGRTTEEGMIFLWAMEKIYLDVWTKVRDGLQQLDIDFAANPTAAATLELAVNWSKSDFVTFVDDLGLVVDSLNLNQNTTAWENAEHVFARVCELEAVFWPSDGDEVKCKRGMMF